MRTTTQLGRNTRPAPALTSVVRECQQFVSVCSNPTDEVQLFKRCCQSILLFWLDRQSARTSHGGQGCFPRGLQVTNMKQQNLAKTDPSSQEQRCTKVNLSLIKTNRTEPNMHSSFPPTFAQAEQDFYSLPCDLATISVPLTRTTNKEQEIMNSICTRTYPTSVT